MPLCVACVHSAGRTGQVLIGIVDGSPSASNSDSESFERITARASRTPNAN